MLAKVRTPAIVGMESTVVEVECDITNGLPSFTVVGLGSQAVSEARDRVRSAIRNSQLLLPPKRITINLAPADLPKEGTAYDVGMAIAILLASKQLDDHGDSLFVGELALHGAVRAVRGVLAHAELAVRNRIKQIFVPVDNASEAALIPGVQVYGVRTLLEIYGHLAGLQPLVPVSPRRITTLASSMQAPDFAAIRGQAAPKRALEIAAAGRHNILLSGPPGAGKTMMSRATLGLLPPPCPHEIIETTKLYSLAGKPRGEAMLQRPFRNPHHTASDVALIGGGRSPRPGEISLSHNGVLFLDELPEFRRDVLEVLRQPLEDGKVTIARAAGSITFPCRFMLIGAKNPCPCGYAGDPTRRCRCSQSIIGNYERRLSGPLLDRMDMLVTVSRVQTEDLQGNFEEEPTTAIAGRVAAAWEAQLARNPGAVLNSQLTSEQTQVVCTLSAAARATMQEALNTLGLSARGYIRTLRVARTVADLAGVEQIERQHVAEAVALRPTA